MFETPPIFDSYCGLIRRHSVSQCGAELPAFVLPARLSSSEHQPIYAEQNVIEAVRVLSAIAQVAGFRVSALAMGLPFPLDKERYPFCRDRGFDALVGFYPVPRASA
jgi:hypothetical protein